MQDDNLINDIENKEINYYQKKPSSSFPKPMIAGILLLIAGVLSIIFWLQFLTIDANTIESIIDISQFTEIDPSITADAILSFLSVCAIIGIVVSIFQVLGGILSIRKNLWGIALSCSIIGLFSLGIAFTSSIMSFIAMILLIISRKEF